MNCGAPWLGRGRTPPATAVATRRRSYKRRRSPEWNPSCSLSGTPGSSTPRDRRVYRPDRKRRWVRPLNPLRRWVESNNSSSLSDSRDRFMLVSYNILGDNNALNHSDLYLDIPFNVLEWNSRKEVIRREISRWNADIVCLQEVDRYDHILSNLRKEGYDGSYKGRTGDAKDGCAILWKEKRFHLLEEDGIEFNAFGLRDNVAQLLVFEMSESGSRRVVVGNIHVLFNPKRGDVKLGQIRMLVSKAHALSEKWGGIPVVLAGDFNSTPQSALYEFLATSKLNISEHDRRYLSGQDIHPPSRCDLPRLIKWFWTEEELRIATGSSKCKQLRHPLKLHSSYASIKASTRTRGPNDEPLATTYHSKFLGTVDYLWHSAGLSSLRVLDTLPLEILRKIGGLPSKDIGSDHLALVSEFVFTDGDHLEQHSTTSTSTEETEEATAPSILTSSFVHLPQKGRKKRKSRLSMNKH